MPAETSLQRYRWGRLHPDNAAKITEQMSKKLSKTARISIEVGFEHGVVSITNPSPETGVGIWAAGFGAGLRGAPLIETAERRALSTNGLTFCSLGSSIRNLHANSRVSPIFLRLLLCRA
jgi:hypothetical protein